MRNSLIYQSTEQVNLAGALDENKVISVDGTTGKRVGARFCYEYFTLRQLLCCLIFSQIVPLCVHLL